MTAELLMIRMCTRNAESTIATVTLGAGDQSVLTTALMHVLPT